jgi:uncharacterized protein (UPF0332 family)
MGKENVIAAIKALLQSEGDTTRRHAGMIHKIGLDFITTGRLDR